MTFSTKLAANLVNVDLAGSTNWWTFNDTVSLFDKSQPAGFENFMTTDSLGNITAWNIYSNGTQLHFVTESYSGTVIDKSTYSNGNIGYNTNSAGTWAVVDTSAPEPSTMVLLASSAAILLAIGKRKHASNA